jgi:hypothetical protein
MSVKPSRSRKKPARDARKGSRQLLLFAGSVATNFRQDGQRLLRFPHHFLQGCTNRTKQEVATELIEVLVALVRVVSRVRMTQAQDDPTLAALLTPAHAVLERLTDVAALNEDISLN